MYRPGLRYVQEYVASVRGTTGKGHRKKTASQTSRKSPLFTDSQTFQIIAWIPEPLQRELVRK